MPPLPAGVYRTCQGDMEMPEPNKTKHPSTPEAMREGTQGSVVMRVIVNADGGTGDILIGQSSGMISIWLPSRP